MNNLLLPLPGEIYVTEDNELIEVISLSYENEERGLLITYKENIDFMETSLKMWNKMALNYKPIKKTKEYRLVSITLFKFLIKYLRFISLLLLKFYEKDNELPSRIQELLEDFILQNRELMSNIKDFVEDKK